MHYTRWVATVFRAVADAGRGDLGVGPSLSAVGTAVGLPGLDRAAFVGRDGPAGALMTAMQDLEQLGLVDFKNVDYGNRLTATGRDVLTSGLESVWPEIFELPLSSEETALVARLYDASLREGDGWVDLDHVDADPIAAHAGILADDHAADLARHQFYGDLARKGFIRRERNTLGSGTRYRPTYLGAVVATAADPRHGATSAGLIDWSVPTPGFDAVERGLVDLKVKLAGTVTDADLSDIGLRCRRLLVDVMHVVYRPEMVPPGQTPPSPQDADEMLGHYLAARLPGKDNEAYRKFLRGAWAIASARVHADRLGRAGAVAAAQGTLGFIRAIEALERELARADA